MLKQFAQMQKMMKKMKGKGAMTRMMGQMKGGGFPAAGSYVEGESALSSAAIFYDKIRRFGWSFS